MRGRARGRGLRQKLWRYAGVFTQEWAVGVAIADIGANDLAYIRKVKAGKTALSCGYTCTLIEQPALWLSKKFQQV